MNAPSTGVLAFGVVALSGIMLMASGPSHGREPPVAAGPATAPAPTSIRAGGVTLTSATIELPTDDAPFPGAAEADSVNANCTACHSASMAMTQPALSAEQWKGVVTKMREAYKAPIAENDVGAIVRYLTAMSQRQRTAPTS